MLEITAPRNVVVTVLMVTVRSALGMTARAALLRQRLT
jgi:hypothetical protein